MNRWLNRANKKVSLVSAATLLVVASLVGQLLGFMRTQIINGQFTPTGHNSTDAYFAAFKIPDFFFYTIAAGALGVAFMPFLADRLEKGDRKTVWELTSSLLNMLGILMAIVGLIILIFTRPLLHLVIGRGLDPETTDHAVTIMRLIAFNPLLFTISGILTSLQQTFGRFFFYAIAPLLYNGCIIASAYIFKQSIGITGLGIGALAGAILQLLLVLFGLYGMNFKYHMVIKFKNADFRRILRQLPPRSIDQGIDALNSIVETNRASTLGAGFISYYENAYILHTAPILLVGTAISTAAFPRLNLRLSQNRPDLFRKDFLMVLRAMIWIILPIAVISFFTRGYLARIIFKANSPEIALIFGFLTGAIIFRTLYSIISRYFYSQKDTVTPLIVSLFAIALNIFLAFTLVKAYGGASQPLQAVTGLAIAQSVVASVEVIILVAIMIWRDPKLFNMEFWQGVVRILSVTGFTILTTYTMVTMVPLLTTDRGFSTLGAKLILIVVPSLAVHLGISSLFGLEEAQPVMKKLKQLVLKPVRVPF
jgi:putative peptidoglycan lipid II flippase